MIKNFRMLLGRAFLVIVMAIFGSVTLILADPINCHPDAPCFDYVWNGSGCSTGCIGMPEQSCCAYNEWRCTGTEDTFRTRTCYSVAQIYCKTLGVDECSIFP